MRPNVHWKKLSLHVPSHMLLQPGEAFPRLLWATPQNSHLLPLTVLLKCCRSLPNPIRSLPDILLHHCPSCTGPKCCSSLSIFYLFWILPLSLLLAYQTQIYFCKCRAQMDSMQLYPLSSLSVSGRLAYFFLMALLRFIFSHSSGFCYSLNRHFLTSPVYQV